MLTTSETSIVIDVGPDFRMQMLNNDVDKVDAVLLTHEHNDHIIGLDDLRPLIFRNKRNMAIYAEARVLDSIRTRFDYAFRKHEYPGIPHFDLIEVNPGDHITIGDIEVEVLRLIHGRLPILGFKVRGLAYLTDTNKIPEETSEMLNDLDYLVLDALHDYPHHSHFTLDQAIAKALEINAKQTYFIHMSHHLGPVDKWISRLPHRIIPAYDGLTLEL